MAAGPQQASAEEVVHWEQYEDGSFLIVVYEPETDEFAWSLLTPAASS